MNFEKKCFQLKITTNEINKLNLYVLNLILKIKVYLQNRFYLKAY